MHLLRGMWIFQSPFSGVFNSDFMYVFMTLFKDDPFNLHFQESSILTVLVKLNEYPSGTFNLHFQESSILTPLIMVLAEHFYTIFQSPFSGVFNSDWWLMYLDLTTHFLSISIFRSLQFWHIVKSKGIDVIIIFQSPFSGVFNSDDGWGMPLQRCVDSFQSPFSGVFNSDNYGKERIKALIEAFQSPFSGVFNSDVIQQV